MSFYVIYFRSHAINVFKKVIFDMRLHWIKYKIDTISSL